jgi:hypothetical protein
MSDMQDKNVRLAYTVSPADFPLGSLESRAAARLMLALRRFPPSITLHFVHAYLNEKDEHIRDENGRPGPCPLCEERRARLSEYRG